MRRLPRARRSTWREALDIRTQQGDGQFVYLVFRPLKDITLPKKEHCQSVAKTHRSANSSDPELCRDTSYFRGKGSTCYEVVKFWAILGHRVGFLGSERGNPRWLTSFFLFKTIQGAPHFENSNLNSQLMSAPPRGVAYLRLTKNRMPPTAQCPRIFDGGEVNQSNIFNKERAAAGRGCLFHQIDSGAWSFDATT